MPAPWVLRASAGLPAGLPASLRSQGPLVHHGYLPSQWAFGALSGGREGVSTPPPLLPRTAAPFFAFFSSSSRPKIEPEQSQALAVRQ